MITRAIKYYGIENFSIELIETCNIDNLNSREVFWIKKLNSKTPNGYNMNVGGDGNRGYKHSEQQNAAKSKRSAGNNNPFYNKKHDDNTKLIISEKGKGRIPWNKGIKMKKESREKLSQTLKTIWKNGKYDQRKSRMK